MDNDPEDEVTVRQCGFAVGLGLCAVPGNAGMSLTMDTTNSNKQEREKEKNGERAWESVGDHDGLGNQFQCQCCGWTAAQTLTPMYHGFPTMKPIGPICSTPPVTCGFPVVPIPPILPSVHVASTISASPEADFPLSAGIDPVPFHPAHIAPALHFPTGTPYRDQYAPISYPFLRGLNTVVSTLPAEHNNGLVDSILSASMRGSKLVLRPDDVWAAILAQVNLALQCADGGEDEDDRIRARGTDVRLMQYNEEKRAGAGVGIGRRPWFRQAENSEIEDIDLVSKERIVKFGRLERQEKVVIASGKGKCTAADDESRLGLTLTKAIDLLRVEYSAPSATDQHRVHHPGIIPTATSTTDDLAATHGRSRSPCIMFRYPRYMPVNLGSRLAPNFSTTMPADQVACSLLLLASDMTAPPPTDEIYERSQRRLVQSQIRTTTKTATATSAPPLPPKASGWGKQPLAGLASVRLMGRREDWERLAQKAATVLLTGSWRSAGGVDNNAYNMEARVRQWWSLLEPVLRELVGVFDEARTETARRFWEAAVVPVADAVVGYRDWTGRQRERRWLGGWITAFCFFRDDGHQLYSTREAQGGVRVGGVWYHVVDVDEIPSACGFSDQVCLLCGQRQLDTALSGGSVGMNLYETRAGNVSSAVSDSTIQPVIGWWLYDSPDGLEINDSYG